MRNSPAIEAKELEGRENFLALVEHFDFKDARTQPADLELVPIPESEDARMHRVLGTPYMLSIKNAAERRLAEAERIRSDLKINSLKNSGELQRRSHDRALLAEIDSRVANNMGLWA